MTALAALAAPASARAATINVTTTDDAVAADGKCSLREAVIAADLGGATDACAAGGGAATIVVPAGRYRLTRTGTEGPGDAHFNDLDILNQTLTIRGAGAASTTIDGNGTDRVFDLNNTGTLNLQGVTVTGGRSGAQPAQSSPIQKDGGAIRALSGVAVSVSGCVFVDNRARDGAAGTDATSAGLATATGGAGGPAGWGGAIFANIPVTVTGTRFERNAAGVGGRGGGATGGTGAAPVAGAAQGGVGAHGGNGGAIWARAGATISNSTFIGDRSGDGGAGGAATGGAAEALAGRTGGPATGGAPGPAGNGGAVAVGGGTTTITGSTFTGNGTGTGAAGGTAAGGSANVAGTTGGAATSVAGEHGGDGGAVWTDTAAAPITLSASTFSGNRTGTGGAGGTATGGPGGAAGTPGAGHKVNGNFGGSGGAVAVGAGGTLTNDTFDANATGPGGAGTGGGTGGAGGSGGAVATTGPDTTTALRNVTVTGNTTGAGGSGGAFSRIFGSIEIGSSVLAGNQAPACADRGQPGTTGDDGANLRSDDASCPGDAGDAKLGPLKDNGGPVPTDALGTGSAAIHHVAGGCPATDARGAARAAGKPCDAGAYERTAPTATTGVASKRSTTGAKVSGSVDPHGPAGSVHFQFGRTTKYGGATATQRTATGFGARTVTANVGRYPGGTLVHYRVVITTSDGTARGADKTFRTVDHTAPKVSKVSLSHRRFAVSGKPTAKSARTSRKTPKGTTFHLKLSESSAVSFAIARRATGRKIRRGKRRVCVAPGHHGLTKTTRCTRYLAAGTLKRKLKPGSRSVAFSGRIGRKALKPGTYRVTITAVDAAHNRSKRSTITFTIVRR